MAIAGKLFASAEENSGGFGTDKAIEKLIKAQNSLKILILGQFKPKISLIA